MKQILVIHGGSTYNSDEEFRMHLDALELEYARLLHRNKWNSWLAEALPEYDVLTPTFPNGSNAKYDEWATYFSKVLRFLAPESILIGHSLGGVFLAKYLNEHPELHFEKVALIAAPFTDTPSESLASFSLPEDMAKLASAANRFALFHSKDDFVVPFNDLAKYSALIPDAEIITFEDRGHLNTPTFPELVEFIKK